MVQFRKQKINVISSAQPWNLYAGPAPKGMTEAQDNEQYWMRDLATRIAQKLTNIGHDARLAPLTDSFRKNVTWCNANRADWIFSVHSNATAKVGDVPKGIGIYTNKAYTAPATRELANSFRLAMGGFPGGSYISTLSVAELSQTFDKGILGEFQFHDSPEMAGWIRDVVNREAMAEAFVMGFANVYGAIQFPETNTPSREAEPLTFREYPAFPLGKINGGQAYFGPKSGPARSVSGYFSHREDFRVWQREAARRGYYKGLPDGLYGPKSAEAARAIQRANGLSVDGFIGRDTWRATWMGR